MKSKKKMTGHYSPAPYRFGCKVVRKWEEPFTDKAGNSAIITKIDYVNPRGKLVEGFTMFVKWVK